QRAGRDATRYVSYATWTCPINCIEPAMCPHTRDVRAWSLHQTLGARAGDVPTALLRVTHRVYGVGMVDVADVVAGDRLVAARLADAGLVRVATASHCHGAVGAIRMAPVPPRIARSEI
ncbi:MAG TPA: hypothetical protein VG916_08945, partial [Gemmatimonadaceae bacterium]|nr:hypothetical protein [Gemmatimonadaceae bacterium]